MKRTIPLLITGCVGALLVITHFLPVAEALGEIAAVHFDILAAIAFILGGGNLVRNHGAKVWRRQSGWGYSGVALIAFLGTLTVGLLKIGVLPQPGYWSRLDGPGQAIGLVQLDISEQRRTLTVRAYALPPEQDHALLIDGAELATIRTNSEGQLLYEVEYRPLLGEPAELPNPPGADLLATVHAGTLFAVADVLRGSFSAYGTHTGEYNQNGGAMWFAYEYGMQPLQATTFAMLAFYVASAAFRAFRARNFEAVLLLGTAFLILLGRTAIATWLTGWLPDEGFWSFFKITNLTTWIMSWLNTAGNRAIIIGIALGIASTSLKVMLGIDRSYLGSER